MLEKMHISCLYGLLWPNSITAITHLRETTEYRDPATVWTTLVISTLCQEPTSSRGKTLDCKYIVVQDRWPADD